MPLGIGCRSESQNRTPTSGDFGSALASSKLRYRPTPPPSRCRSQADCEENPVQKKLTLIFGTILVLSLQLVFRATTMARRWNY
jgi:hypothetical protein